MMKGFSSPFTPLEFFFELLLTENRVSSYDVGQTGLALLEYVRAPLEDWFTQESGPGPDAPMSVEAVRQRLARLKDGSCRGGAWWPHAAIDGLLTELDRAAGGRPEAGDGV